MDQTSKSLLNFPKIEVMGEDGCSLVGFNSSFSGKNQFLERNIEHVELCLHILNSYSSELKTESKSVFSSMEDK